MGLLAQRVTIDAPSAEVWRTISRFGDVYLFNPHVARSTLTSSTSRGLGATRRCELTMRGARMDERVVSWEEGVGYAFDVYASEKTPPFETAGGAIRLRAQGGRTAAIATMQYAIGHGVAGAMLDRVVVRPQLERAFSASLAGLKHHVETGELVDEHTSLDLSSVEITPTT